MAELETYRALLQELKQMKQERREEQERIQIDSRRGIHFQNELSRFNNIASDPNERAFRESENKEQNRALEQVRSHLVVVPTLSCPDFRIPFTLQTSASSVGIGVVLTQTVDGNENITFANRALSGKEVFGYGTGVSIRCLSN